MGNTLKVNIVEDISEVRQRLINIITSDDQFELTHSADNLERGLSGLLACKPDLLLVDIGLPDGSGIELIRAIDKHNLDTQALVISGFQDEQNVFSALEAGAKGYLCKLEEDKKIREAINYILQGGSPISPVIARLILKKFKKPDLQCELPEPLTEKQLAILGYVSQGFTSKEIAEKLSISYYTVTTHIKNIYTKLQVNSRTEAIYQAKKIGLIE